jgi:hypothetical protein
MHPPIQQPERISWTCPLGLRFYDVATNANVISGLEVTATRADVIGSVVKSLLTPSGVHAFHHLPGLPFVDRPDQADPWDPPPDTLEFRIQVMDTEQRFLPCTFLVAAPFRGMAFPVIHGSPPSFDRRGIPLFSASGRNVPPGLVVVRGSLTEYGRTVPAAWAMLEIHYVSGGNNLAAYGMADRKGEMLIAFPRPEGPRRGMGGSPPVSNGQAQFHATLEFFHEPLSPPGEIADYGRRLAQPPAQAFRAGSPSNLMTEAVLSLRTENNLPALELAAS